MKGFLDWLRDVADFVLSVGGALLFLAAAVLFALALRRAWMQSRRTEVIVENLGDATGDATASGAVVGLTFRIREEVVGALPKLAESARSVVERAESDATSPLRSLGLEHMDQRESLLGDISSSQKDLMASMESLVPQAALGAYRVVANSFLRPKEVRVLGVLQRVNDSSGGVGLSFTVNHVGAEEAASRITLWEDEDRDVGAKTIAERFHALVPAAARCLACELLRQRLRVKTSERRRRRRWTQQGEVDRANREAAVEFLVGGLYQDGAHGSAPATKSFYDLAERALRKSGERLDHYKLSFQRANTLAELGRRQGANQAKAIKLLSDSTRLFDEAKTKLAKARLQEADQRAEEVKVQAALTMNACLLAEFLPDDEAKAESAAALAHELTTVDPAEYENPAALYNVACALAVAARVKPLVRHGADARKWLEGAKVSLLHACVRKDRWWTSAEADPDLDLLRDWMPDARRRLAEATFGSGRDKPVSRETVSAWVDKVLEALAPNSPPPPPAVGAEDGSVVGQPRSGASAASSGVRSEGPRESEDQNVPEVEATSQ